MQLFSPYVQHCAVIAIYSLAMYVSLCTSALGLGLLQCPRSEGSCHSRCCRIRRCRRWLGNLAHASTSASLLYAEELDSSIQPREMRNYRCHSRCCRIGRCRRWLGNLAHAPAFVSWMHAEELPGRALCATTRSIVALQRPTLLLGTTLSRCGTFLCVNANYVLVDSQQPQLSETPSLKA